MFDHFRPSVFRQQRILLKAWIDAYCERIAGIDAQPVSGDTEKTGFGAFEEVGGLIDGDDPKNCSQLST